jgi:hypothetical protein
VTRLNVEAVAEDTIAAPENKEPCYIYVSVTIVNKPCRRWRETPIGRNGRLTDQERR